MAGRLEGLLGVAVRIVDLLPSVGGGIICFSKEALWIIAI